jgi:hypothetical protein
MMMLCLVSAPLAAQQVAIQAGGDAATHAVAAGYRGVRLIITSPDGQVFEQRQTGASSNVFQIDTRLMPDGHYSYRLDFTVNGSTGAADTRLAINADGRAQSARPGTRAPAEQGGTFLIQGGQVYFPKASARSDDQDVPGKSAGPVPKDQVFADDLITQGSACIGLDCVNNESFGFDTIRMKENNIRIKFEDTSVGAFPTTDWQLTANDSASGGLNKFSIEDITGARVPFTVEGSAITNSLYIDSTGRIGFRTGTPTLDLHVATGDTPAHRFEQTGASGFTAQTWDVAGNEANFFVRDVTGGSRLPFRIRPGAPTSSIDINALGNVGIGTASPWVKLDINKTVAIASPEIALRVTNSNFGADGGIHPEDFRFEVDSNGNVNARGTISQLSSRTAKEDFKAIDGDNLLAKVDALPISTWRYLAAPDRHLGPVAEDFHQAFGLGNTDKMIAPADLAGVALAAVKALQDQVQQRDAAILALERRLAELEARIAR